MGQLTVTVGPITGRKQFNDTTGQTVILNYLKAQREAEDIDALTNQEKMDLFIDMLAAHVLLFSQSYERQVAEAQARQDAIDNATTWGNPAVSSVRST
jgi:hypothetical protein